MLQKTKPTMVPLIGAILALTLASCTSGKGTPQAAESPATAESTASGSTRDFDGNWWKATSSDQRQGFLAGYTDCIVDDMGEELVFDKSWRTCEEEITSYYTSGDLRRPLSQSIRSLAKPGQMRGEKHEGFGNEWWRVDSQESRRGFVEGFLVCHADGPTKLKWTRSTQFYVEQLDNLYNVDDRNGENGPEYTGSISSAMQQLADDPIRPSASDKP
jgi:hypothetical protein